MQGDGDILSSECVNRPQGRRFESLQCSLNDPARPTVVEALQERSEGRLHIDLIKLGHTRLDQGAQLACALSPHDLLVYINVSLQIWRFFCALAVPIAVSVSPVSISSSVFWSLVVPPIPTCVAAPHFPAVPIPNPLPLPFPLPLPLPVLLPLPLALCLPLPVPLPVALHTTPLER